MTSAVAPTLPDDRGTLTVHDRAVSTIASAAAAAVDGTTAQASTGLAKLAGKKLPRVDVHNTNGVIRLDAAVAVQWPQPIVRTAAATRDYVVADVAEMSGQTVDRVDVTVQAVAAGTPVSVDKSVPALPSGLVPKASPAASSIGVLSSLLLIAGGVVAVREVLVGTNVIGGARWLPPVIEYIDGLQAQSWMVPAGIAAVVVGLIFLWCAVKPRRSTHRALLADGVFLRRKDLASLIEAAVGRVDSVGTARATTSKRRATVAVTATPDADVAQVRRDVTDAVARELAILSPVPDVKITVAAGVEA